jgi:hypothetical protein
MTEVQKLKSPPDAPVFIQPSCCSDEILIYFRKGTEPEPHPKPKPKRKKKQNKTKQNRTELNCTTTTNTQRTITKLNKANEKAFWYVRRNQIADPPTHTDLPPISFWFSISSLFWAVCYGVFEEKEQCHAPSDDVVSHGEGGKERSK